jgi:hypothetical protein
MGLIAEDGHVMEVAPRGQPPRLSLEKVGRNRATTFTGLCAPHDADIFRTLDNQQLDPGDAEHLFLLAYRALLREQHVVQRGREMIRRLDSLPQFLGSASSLEYFDDVADRLSTYRNTYFEPALEEGSFSVIHSRIEEVRTSTATVAASSLYSLDLQTRQDGDIARATLSVLPASKERSLAVISYVADDRALVEPALTEALDGDIEGLPLRLSMLLLQTSENFVLRPGFVESWTEAKKEKVIHAAGLLSVLHTVPNDIDLLLFDTSAIPADG